MKILKKLLKGLLFTILVLLVLVGGFSLYLHESRPEGVSGAEAEALADKMLEAVHSEKWEQLGAIEWDFPRGHHYVWDRKRHFVEVNWGNRRALLAPDEGTAMTYADGQLLSGDEAEEAKKKAYQLFWNDSFWLAAFTKVKDPGTTRELVDLEDEGKALLVTFGSGGLTPGDAYMWKLDDSGRPRSWQMWVDIIPVGGLEFVYEDWSELPGGALVARTHNGMLFDVDLKGIKGGGSVVELGHPADLFSPLESL